MIRGRVLTRDGDAIVPRATVSGFGLGSESEVEADDNGEFVMTGVAAGVAMLGARARGCASAQPEILGVDAGEEVVDVRVLVDPAYSIRGRVTRGERSVAGTKIAAMSLAHGRIQTSAATDEAGAFEIGGLTPGSYSVFASDKALLMGLGTIIETADRDVHDLQLAVRAGVTLIASRRR